jgi:hypothetical protein
MNVSGNSEDGRGNIFHFTAVHINSVTISDVNSDHNARNGGYSVMGEVGNGSATIKLQISRAIMRQANTGSRAIYNWNSRFSGSDSSRGRYITLCKYKQ